MLLQLWKSLYDFMEKSHAWTEDAILDEVSQAAWHSLSVCMWEIGAPGVGDRNACYSIAHPCSEALQPLLHPGMSYLTLLSTGRSTSVLPPGLCADLLLPAVAKQSLLLQMHLRMAMWPYPLRPSGPRWRSTQPGPTRWVSAPSQKLLLASA
jgi:hypothetical protein